jgi:WD40 repeat protein
VLYKDNQPVLKDGRYVYYDTVLRLWDAEKGDELHALKTIHTAPVSPGFFSLDSKDFFSCDAYQTTLLRRSVKEPLKEAVPAFATLKPSVYSFSLVPDGKTLLTMGPGYQITVWDLPELKQRYQWNLPEVVGSWQLATDNRHLAVGLGTGVVYVLRLAPPGVK